jgi:enoyl-CoA hydratase/carnithine racemase
MLPRARVDAISASHRGHRPGGLVYDLARRTGGFCAHADGIGSASEDDVAIDYKKRDGVAYITLDNPDKANILDKPTADALSAAWIDLWEDRDIRCAILTGAGDRHFCAGHNLAPHENITEEEREYLRTQRVFWPLGGTVHGQRTGVDGRMGDHYPRVWKPVVAAVNGWAAGAGLYILLASTDIRIASREHARFKFALTTQGWLGHGPGATLLVRQLRYIDAMKMLLTDEPVHAEEALRIGLVNEVVPHAQLLERAEQIARHVVNLPPVALRMMKEFVVRFGELPTDQAWHVQNLINNLLIQMTIDGEEGRRAFNEKRPAHFTGALRRRGKAWEEPSDEDRERLDEAYRSGEY